MLSDVQKKERRGSEKYLRECGREQKAYKKLNLFLDVDSKWCLSIFLGIYLKVEKVNENKECFILCRNLYRIKKLDILLDILDQKGMAIKLLLWSSEWLKYYQTKVLKKIKGIEMPQ